MGKKKPAADEEKKPLTFEEALRQLEEIVANLEEGQLGLSQSLEQYEHGIKHLKQCYRLLEQAERKIELLTGVGEQGQPVTEPFDEAGMTLQQKQESRSRRRSRPNTSAAGGSSNPEIDDTPGLF